MIKNFYDSSPGTAIGGYNQCLKKASKIKN